MAHGRADAHAVLLGDGTVLVVGTLENPTGVRPDSRTVEIFDPEQGTWSAGTSLNHPRAEAVVVATRGRALVAGGVDPGVIGEWLCDRPKPLSYSSTYLYDPATGHVWQRQRLLGSARSGAAGTALPDGRVLVAGGYYLGGQPAGALERARPLLAAYRPTRVDLPRPSPETFTDATPPTGVPALATAEVFDPATGVWTTTGPMRYARVGAAAATLSDGRVLVVGSDWDTSHPGYTVSALDQRAISTAEVWDPRTGRFDLIDDPPSPDLSVLASEGITLDTTELLDAGELVSLLDGGALLVGRHTLWYGTTEPDGKAARGASVDSWRLDPGSGRWTHVDGRLVRWWFDGEGGRQAELVGGHAYVDAAVARLADGRILVAGGALGAFGSNESVSTESSVYDPLTGAWTRLPPMPEPRAGAAAVTLGDGSVLVIGGYGAEGRPDGPDRVYDCTDEATGLASAIRFVPGG